MSNDYQKTVIVIGGGWYGCYISLLLAKHSHVKVILMERNSEIFYNNASLFNQCRLHQGFHYPRSKKTRTLCIEGFDLFMQEFPELHYEVPNNLYVISKESILDYETYRGIFEHEKYNFDIIDIPQSLENLEGSAIKVHERAIDPFKSKEYFKRILNSTANIELMVNCKVLNIDNEKLNYLHGGKRKSKVLQFDHCFDCTNFSINCETEVKYEKVISLVYKKKKDVKLDFGALTVMDGKFFSIYPWNEKEDTFTLTHVNHSVLEISANPIKNSKIRNKTLKKIRADMEKDVCKVYNKFLSHFDYHDYFVSLKTKPKSASDGRGLLVENVKPHVTRISCGKITGIFYLKKLVANLLGENKLKGNLDLKLKKI